LKQVVIDKQLTTFNHYLELIIEELESKSHESSKLPKFSKSPYVPREFMEIANILSKVFDEKFFEFQGKYFIQDSSINVTFFSKK